MDESFILAKFDGLVKSGLVLYDDKQETIEHIDGGLKFHFILTSALAKKPTLQSPPSQACDQSPLAHSRRAGSDISTAEYEIGDVGHHHFLAANKFCYARPHAMLLTRDGHRRQHEALDDRDLTAAVTSLHAIAQDYAVFYNCGQDGGCSRRHKHLQLMPLPSDVTFAAFLDRAEGVEPRVPFAWFYHRFGEQAVTPAGVVSVYAELLRRAEAVGRGRGQHADTMPLGAACPHNMILTKRWMVVVPRRRAAVCKEVGTNAMGMLGYIVAATQGEIDTWVRLGPKEILGQLGVPEAC